MRLHGKPTNIRWDNGAEFTVTAVMRWLRDQNVGPVFIKPGSHGRTAQSKASTASYAMNA